MAFAQGGATGAISGVIQDPSGAVVPNAEVQVINQQTGVLVRTLTSDANGSFTAQLLPVGRYKIVVKSGGFAESTFSDVDVRITETARVTVKLNTQTQQQQIEVQAEVLQVETSTAAAGQAIEAQTIRSLPLATQNFQQLLTLFLPQTMSIGGWYLAEVGLPFRVERRVAAVAVEQRQLDLDVPRPVEQRLVDVPGVGADRLLVPVGPSVYCQMVASRVRKAPQRLLALRRLFLPVSLDRFPEIVVDREFAADAVVDAPAGCLPC